MRWKISWVAALLVVPFAPAQAAWQEASSDHFIIYANDSDRDVTLFAQQLEKYHAGLAFVTGSAPAAPSPSNRVTVYVVKDERQVRAIYGSGNSNVAGFYVPKAGGSMAIVPAVQTGTGTLSWSMLVLLHEYAHHFQIASDGPALPRWVSEGSAEFFATAQFERDGSMWLGRPANHRAGELFYAQDVEVADLLDPTEYDKRKSRSQDAFYGKSWLLFHYLTFEPSRKGQFKRYVELLAEGKSQRAAATEAFGDFSILEKDVDRYLKQSRLTAIKLAPQQLHTGAIVVRALRPGEAAMMPVRIRSKKRVTGAGEEAVALLLQAKEIVVRYPNDPAVLSALAECEHDAGHDAEAVAAADAALRLDPKQINAYVQKGLALFRLAKVANDKAAAYKAANAPFIALNKIENDHPLPLMYYYRNFVEQGKTPTPLAVNGLIRAVQMAPFDMGLRMNLGIALLRLGRGADAAIILAPVGYNPHGGKLATAARSILDRLGKKPDWKGEDLSQDSSEVSEDAES